MYSRKVEYLHSLVYRALDVIADTRRCAPLVPPKPLTAFDEAHAAAISGMQLSRWPAPASY